MCWRKAVFATASQEIDCGYEAAKTFVDWLSITNIATGTTLHNACG